MSDESIPVGELRTLAKKWRNESEYMVENSSKYADPKLTEQAAECLTDSANQLERLIEDHTDE